jgi:hypothetical protein
MAAAMTVFITILLGFLSSPPSEIYIPAPAFINSEAIRMIRVPPIKKLRLNE